MTTIGKETALNLDVKPAATNRPKTVNPEPFKLADNRSQPDKSVFNQPFNNTFNKNPTVSIGLPVYNGENFIGAAIESILQQTFQDYELIISDNASTDRTAEICQRYASQDPRIRYYRNPTNRGPAWNYNQVFHLSNGEYFKWVAHDDVLAPTFIEATLATLIADESAVLSFSKVNIIDETSRIIKPYDVALSGDSNRPATRFKAMIDVKHRCYDIFGLFRTSALAKTSLIGSYAGSDRVLLGRISLQGKLQTIPERLFQAREHGQQSIAMLRQPLHKHLRMHHYAVWFDPQNKGKILLPNWRILAEYLAAIHAVPLTLSNRVGCYLVLIHWLFSYQNWAKLGRDVAIALLQITSKLLSKSVTPAIILLRKIKRSPV